MPLIHNNSGFAELSANAVFVGVCDTVTALNYNDKKGEKPMEQSKLKTYLHNPPHLFIPNAKYFITGATLHKIHYFKTDEIKEKIREYLFESFDYFNWDIEEWVILGNHYHLISQAPEVATTLPQMMNNFHRFSGLWVKKYLGLIGKNKIFHNYWDTCVRCEKDYFGYVNYLWCNPVKHQYTDRVEEWKFSSYFQRSISEVEKIFSYSYDDLNIYDNF
jgi:REP element-mobilizing transposase RayT